jgi:hypothetical protein
VNFLLPDLARTLLIPSSNSSTSFLGSGSSDFSRITRFLTASNVTVWRFPSARALIVSRLYTLTTASRRWIPTRRWVTLSAPHSTSNSRLL